MVRSGSSTTETELQEDREGENGGQQTRAGISVDGGIRGVSSGTNDGRENSNILNEAQFMQLDGKKSGQFENSVMLEEFN